MKLSLTDIPEYLLLLVIFALPWQTRWIAVAGVLNGSPWEYGTISVYAVDMLIALAFCAVAAFHVVRKHNIQLTLAHYCALFLLFIAFLSNTFANNTLSSLFWFIKLAEGVSLFFCISLGFVRLRFSRVVWTLSAAGIIQSGLALWQFATQKVVGASLFGIAAQDPQTLGVQVIENTLGRTLRAYGSLPHPNMLGGFLVICIIAGVLRLCDTHAIKERIILGAILALESSALMMTFSRQSWIALGVALAVFVGYTFAREKTFPGVILCAVACIAIPILSFALSFPELMHTRIDATTRLEQKSVNERQVYLDQTVDILQGHWFVGVGIGNDTAFLQAQDRGQNIYKAGDTYQPVHNIYLLAFAELGLFGLIAYIFTLLSVFYQARWHNAETITWGLSVIALCVIGFFDHYLWSLHFGILLFWVVTGLAVASQSPVENSAVDTPPSIL